MLTKKKKVNKGVGEHPSGDAAHSLTLYSKFQWMPLPI